MIYISAFLIFYISIVYKFDSSALFSCKKILNLIVISFIFFLFDVDCIVTYLLPLFVEGILVFLTKTPLANVSL